MMIKTKLRAGSAVVFFAVFFFVGCNVFEPVVDETKHFTLRDPDGQAASPGDRPVRLATVRLPDFMDNRRVLYRDGARVISDSRSMWIEPLGDGFRAALAESLSKLGYAVDSSRSGGPRLEITVIRLDAFLDGRLLAEVQWQAGEQSGFFNSQAPWRAGETASLVYAYRQIIAELAERLVAGLSLDESKVP